MEYDPSAPLESFARTVRAVLLSPISFFSSLILRDTDEERVGAATLFFVVCTLLYVVLGGAYEIIAAVARGEISGITVFGVEGYGAVAIFAAIYLILAPVAAVIGLYIGAFLLHILVTIFAGEDRRTYYSTLKILAYTSLTGLVTWIPVVWFLAGIYQAYLLAVGVREMHRSTGTRAAVVAILAFVASGGGLFVGAPEMILEGGLG